MEKDRSAMASLLAEYGDKFDLFNEPTVVEDPKEEVKVEEEKTVVMKDITIKCKKCENDFVWTVKEQEFYKEKGFYRPSYCKDCRKKSKVVNNFHADTRLKK